MQLISELLLSLCFLYQPPAHTVPSQRGDVVAMPIVRDLPPGSPLKIKDGKVHASPSTYGMVKVQTIDDSGKWVDSWIDPDKPPTQPAPTPAPAAGAIVSLPKVMSGAPGELLPVTAESGAALISWAATPGLRVVSDHPADPSCKSMLIHAKAGGVYTLVAMIPADGGGVRSAVSVVTIGEPPPPPPPPAPTFQSRLADAFKADGATPEQAGLLAALYRKASTSTVRDAGLTTAGQLLAEMQRAVKLLGLPPGSLGKTVRVIQGELDGMLPTNPAAPLDAATRDRIAAAFQHVATALEGLK